MRVFLVLASLFLLSNAIHVDQEVKEKIMEKVEAYATKCLEETKANDDDIAEILSHKLPPTSHEAKCMLFCMNKAFNMVTDNGEINKEEILKFMDIIKTSDPDIYEKLVKVLDICSGSHKVDSDPCISTTNFATCSYKEAESLGITDELFELME